MATANSKVLGVSKSGVLAKAVVVSKTVLKTNGKLDTTSVKAAVAKEVVAKGAPAAKKLSFKVGEKVVYPSHGVGEIVAIVKKNIGGMEIEGYDIAITDKRFWVALSQIESVGLRHVVNRKAVDKVYEILKDRNFKVDTQTWNRRQREYTQKIKTGSVFEIATVIRDLSVLGVDKELSSGEKRMLYTAQSLLVSEIAVAKARPQDRVMGEIRAIFT